MVMRVQINQGDGHEDAAALSIASNVLRSLVMVITQVMTTAIANATVPVPITPNTITYSSAIDPYNDESFETKIKEGKYRWHLITMTAEGWEKYSVYPTVEQANKILDLFKYCSVQFELENIINNPTSGTGADDDAPQ